MSSPTGSEELTRKQKREQARAQRKAAEEAARARAARRKRMNQFGAAVLALAVVAVVAAVVAGSGGGGSHAAAPTTAATPGSLPGLSTASAPWPPEYNSLAQRLQDLNLPTESDAAYHIHAHLQIYVDGKNITVPSQVGIDPQGQFLAPLHTHDTSGVVHMESSQAYPFKLGQFFDVWGVKFTPTQLGGYQAGPGKVLQTYVNGKLVPNGPTYQMQPHDLVIVGYGKPGSFPTNVPYTFAPGL